MLILHISLLTFVQIQAEHSRAWGRTAEQERRREKNKRQVE